MEASSHLFAAASRVECTDKLQLATVFRNISSLLMQGESYRAAMDHEKAAYHIYTALLTDKHELSLACLQNVKDLTTMAVRQGKMIKSEQMSSSNGYAQVEAAAAAGEDGKKKVAGKKSKNAKKKSAKKKKDDKKAAEKEGAEVAAAASKEA
jgi:hypothetical protein